MQINWEVLLYITIPSLLVLGMAFLMLQKFFKNEQHKRVYELRTEIAKTVTPIKLQAYERMAIFLERIRPAALVRRLQHSSDNLDAYEYLLIHTIQSEFEHNLAQQIYIHPETWKIIFSAKNATIGFIKTCRKSLPEDASVEKFKETIIHRSFEENPGGSAMLYLQKDIQGL